MLAGTAPSSLPGALAPEGGAVRPAWQRHFDFSHPQSGIDLFARQIREFADQALFTHELAAGLRVDAGLSRSRRAAVGGMPPALQSGTEAYRDLFVGFRYHGLGGHAWRLDPRSAEARGFDTRWYYEAGVEHQLTERWSVSLHMGTSARIDLLADPRLDFSLGTRYRLRGFDLGLRLIDQDQRLTGRPGLGGLSFMGSLSRRFP
ncbi:MAG: hypothetical protein D6721_09310 [Gammaproteobacteria bacterium]|nr:MAG: hypothetical protein D6721_09310 [Gammaproteobacteria bacterium]